MSIPEALWLKGQVMSILTPTEPETRVQKPDAELPDARVLEDKTPEWMRSTPSSSLLVLAIGIVFILRASGPLWHTDLWDHLNYGKNIIETRVVSSTEPIMRLCRGVSMVNIPWLAQVGMATLNERFGLTSLQFAYALTISLSLGVVAWRATKLSHSVLGGIIAAAIFYKVNLSQFLVIRPQVAGVLFYCVVVAWMTGQRRFSKLTWIGFPLMFALWANVHGSFSMGLFLLGITAIGRFADVLVISRKFRTAIADRQLHRTLLLIQLCAAAVLVNPAGLAIYPEVLNVAKNPNIESMFEWDAMTLRSADGQAAAAAALLAFFAFKLSPRRMKSGEILAFVVTGLLAAWSERMINWWTPIAGIMTATHLLAAMRRTTPWLRNPQPQKASGLWSLVNLGMLWIFFGLTTFGVQIVHGRVPDMKRLVSPETPLATVAFLESMETLPRGISLIPAEWTGYVMNRGPKQLEPMVNLHVHVIPERVWSDYIRLINGPTDWNGLMDEYGINLAVSDKAKQAALVKRIRESADWSVSYEDRQAVVFVRRKPI